MKDKMRFMTILLAMLIMPFVARSAAPEAARLSVKQVMNAMITPMTSIIWGAQELNTDAQRQEVINAALTLIGAGNLLANGGSGDDDNSWAQESNWQQFNREMMVAASAVISAVEAQDTEALFSAGNDRLYPPCENCHQQYQSR